MTLGATLAMAALVAPATAVAAGTADRLAGTDRYDTAIQIADAFGTADTVYLARGDNQADAVAGGKLLGGPLLLVNENARTQEDVAAEIKRLKAKNVVVLGGKGAVSETTVKAVAGETKVTRIAGSNRFETAAEVSRVLTDGKTAAKVYLANGLTLVDALVGGTITDGAPVLLTNGSGELPQATVDEIKRLKPTEVVALGGTGAVKAEELNAAASVNGAGGGLNEAAAKAKVKTDLVKAVREARLLVEGYFTVADGKSVDDFLASKCAVVPADEKPAAGKAGDKGDDKAAADKAVAAKKALKETLESTFPRVLPSEVTAAAACTDKVLKVDGASAGTREEAAAKAAKAVKVDGKNVATYLGTQAVYDAATKIVTEAKDKATEAEKLAKSEAEVANLKATKALNDAKADLADFDKATPSDKVKQLIQAAMGAGGAKVSRIAGSDRYLTALEIAKVAYPSGGGAQAVYVANGTASADATVAGFIDNKAGLAGPVLLVKADAVPAEVEAYLKAARQANSALEGKFKALGGKVVVSDTVVDAVKALLK